MSFYIMNRILSGIDYRIINFMANTGRMPNQEERARLLGHGVNNANNPNIQDLQNRIAVLTNERNQARADNNQLIEERDRANREKDEILENFKKSQESLRNANNEVLSWYNQYGQANKDKQRLEGQNDELNNENNQLKNQIQDLKDNVGQLQQNLANIGHFNNVRACVIDDFEILANSRPQNEVIQGEHSGMLENTNRGQDIEVDLNNLVLHFENQDNSNNGQNDDINSLASNLNGSRNVVNNSENNNPIHSKSVDDNQQIDTEEKNALIKIKEIFGKEINFSAAKNIKGALTADGVKSMGNLLNKRDLYKGTGDLHKALIDILNEFENGERVGPKKNYLCKDAVDKIRGILKKVEDLLS